MSSLKSLESAQRPKSPWICGQRKSVAHKLHRPNNSKKKRTFDVLQNADIFTRYGHPASFDPARFGCIAETGAAHEYES